MPSYEVVSQVFRRLSEGSEVSSITVGVPQGSVLHSLLCYYAVKHSKICYVSDYDIGNSILSKEEIN